MEWGVNFEACVYLILEIATCYFIILSMSNEQTNRLFLTNNYSIVSKYSAARSGYFNDKILEEFIEKHLTSKSWRRTPLVNRGYAARLMAIDYVVSRTITMDSVNCFIVLGAGYDTVAFRKQDHKCCWIELDLPQVIEVKAKFIVERNILKNENLVQVEPGRFRSTSLNYHLVACDLRDTTNLASILQTILNHLKEHSSEPKNFAIINEVCLCYMETNEIKRLLETVVESVRESAHKIQYIGYEQVKPEEESQFASIMLDHFSSLGHPLKHYPSPKQIHQLFIDRLGFNQINVESMHKIFYEDLYNLRDQYRGYHEEPFDEFEEMDLYLSHYALVTGSLYIKSPPKLQSNHQSAKISSCDFISEFDRQSRGIEMSVDGKVTIIKSDIQRFGHSSCSLREGNSGDVRVLSSGGFGKSFNSSSSGSSSQKHKRLSDCLLLSKDRAGSINVQLVDSGDLVSKSIHLDRMYGQICELSDSLLFFNGGRQSPCNQKPGNIPFVANLDETQLVVKHKFEFENSKPTLRWRHQIMKLNKDEVIQLGGNKTPTNEAHSHGSQIDDFCVTMWNLSSDKLGFREGPNNPMLLRHSFGLDRRDSNTLLIYGGLDASNAMTRDKLVCLDTTALLWDLREESPTKLRVNLESARCYGSNVHFTSEYQFAKIGGVSALDGLASGIELFDLRHTEQPLVQSFRLPVIDGEPMLLINATTSHLKRERKIITIGGGGNYFTFGTSFNKSLLVFEY